MTYNKKTLGAAPIALLGAVSALILGGCGGATTSGTQITPTPNTTPVVYGLHAQAVTRGSFLQVSGLGSPDATVGYVTGAVASTAVPVPAQTVNGTIPLGFAPGGRFINESFGQAVAPGANVIFRASVANGTDAATGMVIPINPNGVVLTSSDVPGFSLPLSFSLAPAGPLANGQYTTAPFALPFTTTGLHSLTVSVTDQKPQTSTTTFDVVVVAPTDAAVVAQIVRPGATASAAPVRVPGATATITNPVTGARSQATADAQGVVILFAAPGEQTISVTATNAQTGATLSGSDTPTLVAGQALVSTGATPTPYRITIQ